MHQLHAHLHLSFCAALLSLAVLPCWPLPAHALVRCEASDDAHLVVDLSAHELVCCELQKVVASYGVRIGSAGGGKRAEGDHKTPIGSYGLGAPRASASYGTFISIAYPTPEQLRSGFTGGAVGVHGPDRRLRWLGSLVNTFDTTDGCVGIATDAEMDRLASWVRNKTARRIYLR